MQRSSALPKAVFCGKYALSGIDLRFCVLISSRMKPEERERMYQLCALIEKEKDHSRFLKLINELNELLERKEQQLENQAEKKK